jgi:3-keto-5-aminohexanoate cleavage enzyme
MVASPPPRTDPIAIAAAPNGARRTKTDHPALPITAAELARTAAECLEAGASMIHLHVRRPDGSHLLDPDAYRAATAAIRAEVGDRLVVQITSEAAGLYSPDQQMAVVRSVRPEAVSLALRELSQGDAAERSFIEFLDWIHRENILSQLILYTPDEASRLSKLLQSGNLPFDDLPVLYVLGRYSAGQRSRPADLLPFLAEGAPRFGSWMACAFGPDEIACVTAAALLGGDARVGFENNIWLPDGSLAPSNAAAVAGAAEALRRCGRTIAGADELRRRWRA